MSVKLEIVPFATTLDMYGVPDSSSAYSLSGHVCLTLKPSFTLFESRKPANLLLQSLELTFEGQSEIVAPNFGYSALRLCSVTRELAPTEGIELSNEGQDPKESCRWNVLFSLPIPGWLPQSSRFGIENVGTRYALYATARILDLSNYNTCLSALCSSFRSRRWSINACKTITLKRYDQPPATEAPEIRLSTYSVQCKVLAKTTFPSIPSQTFEQLQILASAPSFVDIRDHKFPLKINIKALNISKASCERLYLTDLSVDVVQTDKLSSRPSQQFASRFSIPGESLQPPYLPLRHPHHLSLLSEAGLSPTVPPKDAHIEREFSLLHERDRTFKLGGSDIFLSDDPNSESSTWLTLETVVPFNHRGLGQSEDEWAGPSKLRPTESGPLFAVQHEVRVSLGLTYDFPDGQVATEILYFRVPLRFMHVAPLLPVIDVSPTLLIDSPTAAPSLPPLIPYALPAYSQLFYSNGERKLDPMPLPLYSLRDPEEDSEPSQASKEYQVDIDESSEQSGLLTNDSY